MTARISPESFGGSFGSSKNKDLKTMPEQVQVSVIIPCYRCVDTIDRALASVAGQSKLPAEVILVDDCSDDSTLAALYRAQASYPRGWIIVIELAENSGPGTARNVGWEAATQPYVAFLDSDDSWHPRKLEIQHDWMQSHPDVILTGHGFRQIDDSKNAVEEASCSITDGAFYEISKNKLLLANRFPTCSVMLRRDIAQRFTEGKRYCEDYQLWVEVCCVGLKCYRSDLSLVYLYKAAYGASGLSASLWRMERGELGAYAAVFKKGYIGFVSMALLSMWSLARFVRRLARS
jgi:glycosyltransferase involved in cell wall biosynthesis